MSTEDTAPQPGDRLYQHVKRKQWGLAVLTWERDGKRAFQFEDGELRVFAEAFYKLLQEVETPPEQAARLMAKLGRQGGLGKGDGKSEERLLTAAEQVQVFLEQFPDGFEGAEWKSEHRGEGASRRLKRHRDGAADSAREQLSKEALDELIAAGDHGEVLKRMIDVVHGSDLVTRAQAEPVATATASPELSAGLRDLLYGSGDFEARFDEYCRLLLEAGRKQISWPLASAVQALVQPEAHVAVRPTVLSKQAQWAYPRLRYSTKPEGKVYTRILTMARTVRDALAKAGQPPKDMLDVYDFMLVTLRPAAVKILDEVRRRAELMGDHEESAAGEGDGEADELPPDDAELDEADADDDADADDESDEDEADEDDDPAQAAG